MTTIKRLPFYFSNMAASRFAAGLLVGSIACCAHAASPEAPAPLPALATTQSTTHCRNNLQSPIANFCEVAPNILWRGAKPDEQGTGWLIAHGVRTVVNLELLHDDLADFGSVKIDAALKTDVQYFRIRDWEPLATFAPAITDQNVAQFLAIMKQSPKPVYVHCRSGQNRTGVMVAAYRLLIENAELEKTIAEMKQYHGFWSFADSRYLRGLAKRRDAILLQANGNMPKRNAQIACANGVCIIELLDP